ncbi:MAG: HD domain-containing protein [Promethearchaeota archaeon]
MSESKIVRDIVHGYIELNEDDLNFIDTPIFQRLKRIRQTTANAVYPNANHTRYEHSLGVMQLGQNIFDSLRRRDQFADNKRLEEFEKTFRYACLLHDIGHTPFSHTLEGFYNELKCKNLLKKIDGITFDVENEENAAPHERMSCIVAFDSFKNELQKMMVDFDLFCRMILGISYSSKDKEKNFLNPLISILNSHVDSDKLDYLLRDSFMTGVNLLILDRDRIVNSFIIHNNELILNAKSLSTISNLIYGRNALYMWVYNHHVVVYYSSILKRLIKYLIEKDGDIQEKYFSSKSIINELIDDSDIIQLLKNKKMLDENTKQLCDQFFNRNYLKPLWKTPFEYQNFLIKTNNQNKIKTDAKSGKLEADLLRDLSLKSYELMVVFAEYKPFNPEGTSNIHLLINDSRKMFTEIFQKSIFLDDFQEIPYIFVKKDDVELKEEILEKLKKL